MRVVLGYGNSLRSDDGVGPAVACSVGSWGLSGVVALALHSLTPELAVLLSQAEDIIFVDADVAADADAVRLVELAPGNPSSLGHLSEPASLLTLTQTLADRRPRAWLLTIPGQNFEMGEGFSPRAQQGMDEALRIVREWLS